LILRRQVRVHDSPGKGTHLAIESLPDFHSHVLRTPGWIEVSDLESGGATSGQDRIILRESDLWKIAANQSPFVPKLRDVSGEQGSLTGVLSQTKFNMKQLAKNNNPLVTVETGEETADRTRRTGLPRRFKLVA